MFQHPWLEAHRLWELYGLPPLLVLHRCVSVLGRLRLDLPSLGDLEPEPSGDGDRADASGGGRLPGCHHLSKRFEM